MSVTPAIPKVPQAADAETRKFLEAVKTLLEVRADKRGPVNERFVTVGDLADADIVQIRAAVASGFSKSTSLVNASNAASSPTTPDGITNVSTNVTATSNIITWDYNYLYPLSFFEIWRATATNAGTAQDPDWQGSLSNAGIVGIDRGQIYVDQAVTSGQVYVYWVRAIGPTGLAGPYDSTDGTVAETTEDIIGAITAGSEAIKQSHLSSTLVSDIPTLAGVPDVVEDVTALEANLEATYVVKASVDGKVTGFGLYNDGTTSQFAVYADQFAITYDDTIISNQTYTLTSSQTASLSVDSSYAVVIDASQGSNGYFSVTNNHPTQPVTLKIRRFIFNGNDDSSSFTINLDDSNSGGNNVASINVGVTDNSVQQVEIAYMRPNPTEVAVPFYVKGGVVYINTAVIEDASITNAKLANISADKITTGTLDASNVTISNLTLASGSITGDLSTVNNAFTVNANAAAGEPVGTFSTIAIDDSFINRGTIEGGDIKGADIYFEEAPWILVSGTAGTSSEVYTRFAEWPYDLSSNKLHTATSNQYEEANFTFNMPTGTSGLKSATASQPSSGHWNNRIRTVAGHRIEGSFYLWTQDGAPDNSDWGDRSISIYVGSTRVYQTPNFDFSDFGAFNSSGNGTTATKTKTKTETISGTSYTSTVTVTQGINTRGSDPKTEVYFTVSNAWIYGNGNISITANFTTWAGDSKIRGTSNSGGVSQGEVTLFLASRMAN